MSTLSPMTATETLRSRWGGGAFATLQKKAGSRLRFSKAPVKMPANLRKLLPIK
jgi:hypothetical protein